MVHSTQLDKIRDNIMEGEAVDYDDLADKIVSSEGDHGCAIAGLLRLGNGQIDHDNLIRLAVQKLKNKPSEFITENAPNLIDTFFRALYAVEREGNYECSAYHNDLLTILESNSFRQSIENKIKVLELEKDYWSEEDAKNYREYYEFFKWHYSGEPANYKPAMIKKREEKKLKSNELRKRIKVTKLE